MFLNASSNIQRPNDVLVCSFKWHKLFKNGSVQVITPPRTGRPVLTSNYMMRRKLDVLLAKDDSLTQYQIAALVSISRGTVQMLLKKLTFVAYTVIGYRIFSHKSECSSM